MGETAVLDRPTLRVKRSDSRVSRRWWLVVSAVFGAVAGVGLVWLTCTALLDDALITLSYARNLAKHGQWGVTPGLASNTATSPLFVLLLAAPMLLVGPVVSLAAVTAGLLATCSVSVSALARRLGWSPIAGPVAVALLVTSPLMQASVGLESLLAVTLFAVAAHELAAGRGVGVGVAAGALVLTRPDLGIVSVLAVLLCWRRVHVAMTATCAVVAPWLVVSLAMFGTVLPDTLIWKQSQTGGMGGYLFGDAVALFWRVWPAVTGLAVAAGVVAVLGWLWLLVKTPQRAPIVLLGAGGLAHLAALYTLHVAPYPWYPAPAAGAGMLLLGLATAVPGWWARGPVLAVSAALIAAGVVYSARHDYPGKGSPVNYNRATPAQYAAVVARVPDGAVLETYEELGAVAFFCGDRCTVVDALSDRGRLAPLLTERLASSPLLHALYPGYEPTPPTAATWRVTVGDSGIPTYSSYGNGWSTMNVEPVTK